MLFYCIPTVADTGTPAMRTPEEVKEEFRRRGVSINAWARSKHVSAALVHQVLSGKKRCLRGQSHNIAVLLGLKEGVLSTELELSNLFQPNRAGGAPPDH